MAERKQLKLPRMRFCAPLRKRTVVVFSWFSSIEMSSGVSPSLFGLRYLVQSLLLLDGGMIVGANILLYCHAHIIVRY